VRHKLAYRRPRGVVCSLEERHRLRLFSFRFVGIAMLLVFSGSGLVRVIVSLIASLAVSFVVSESGLVCAYQLSFSSASRCCTSPRAAASCALSAFSSPASRCRRFSRTAASCAPISCQKVSHTVFSDGGLVCAYQLSESIPYELVRGADFSPLRRQLLSKFCLVKGVLFLARRRLHDQRL
jgi:hypothetical protein